MKNIGTGGTPAIAKIETRAITLKDGRLVNDCNEFKNTIPFKLKFNITKTKFKKDNK